ncbi:MAG: hypothetical protein KDB14_32680 [Planctomycetales bacterium]|nr:hypothetical protein [Planctomycetales bacterium]
MRPCDLNSGMGRLTRAANDLRDRWRDTREQWTDGACRKFEADYLQALAPLLSQVSAAVTKFAEVIAEAESECADPDRPDSGLI